MGNGKEGKKKTRRQFSQRNAGCVMLAAILPRETLAPCVNGHNNKLRYDYMNILSLAEASTHHLEDKRLHLSWRED